jgi:GntR family transcriptional regulator
MQLSIEPNNGIPIYEQLVRQIKYAIAEGVLVPGQVIPSVRDLAKQLTTSERRHLAIAEGSRSCRLRGSEEAVRRGSAASIGRATGGGT